MKHVSALILLLVITSHAAAVECHYFWTSDCFEIRDPRTRDITHHVLLSEHRYRFQASAPGQCAVELEASLSIDHRGQVMRAFNRQLGRISGCRALETLSPQVFEDEGTAVAQWQRLATERNFKRLHLIRRLPGQR
jgi:heme oxygenase